MLLLLLLSLLLLLLLVLLFADFGVSALSVFQTVPRCRCGHCYLGPMVFVTKKKGTLKSLNHKSPLEFGMFTC